MAASEVASFDMNFFRIAGTSEAETSVSGKAECLLAIGEDKASKFFGVTRSPKCRLTGRLSVESHLIVYRLPVSYLCFLWLAIRFKITTGYTRLFLPRILVYIRYVWALSPYIRPFRSRIYAFLKGHIFA